MGQTEKDLKQVIRQLLDCYQSCLETVGHRLDLGGKFAEREHIQLLQLCAQICHTSATALLMDSSFYGRVCALCADICEESAADQSMDDDDEIRDCARMCRKTADTCHAVAGDGDELSVLREQKASGT